MNPTPLWIKKMVQESALSVSASLPVEIEYFVPQYQVVSAQTAPTTHNKFLPFMPLSQESAARLEQNFVRGLTACGAAT